MMRLLSLPEQVIAYINNGELSMGHGRALLSVKNEDQLLELVTKIRKEKLNVRQVEQLIQQINKESNKKKEKPKKDVFIQNTETRLREQFGTAVNIQRGKKKGKIEIEFYSDEDLERLIEILSE